MSLCKRGKEAAKEKYDVYPSAYANAYAVQVCKGNKPDADGVKKPDKNYVNSMSESDGSLQRWFDEKWVDVCDGTECGRDTARGVDDYPYCRPSVRVNEETPQTTGELGKKELAKRCKEKRELEKKSSRVRGRSPARKTTRGRSKNRSKAPKRGSTPKRGNTPKRGSTPKRGKSISRRRSNSRTMCNKEPRKPNRLVK